MRKIYSIGHSHPLSSGTPITKSPSYCTFSIGLDYFKAIKGDLDKGNFISTRCVVTYLHIEIHDLIRVCVDLSQCTFQFS